MHSIHRPLEVGGSPPSTRWLGILLVLGLHLLALWGLMVHRLLPERADKAVTLMVNFIAPPSPTSLPQQPAPSRPKAAGTKPTPRQPLVAETPQVSNADNLAPPMPDVVATTSLAIANTPNPPAMPLPSGPIALGGELSVVCPTRPAPNYPALSRRLGETGRVVLRVTLSTQGDVRHVSIAQSSGYPRLDETALQAIRHWRCTPPLRQGQPVEASALQPFNFVLEGSS